MTNPIDIGSGINALELFGDIWGNSKEIAVPQPAPPPPQSDFKTTYLETQKAIINKDFALFNSGLQKMKGVLTNKQINTLGREILRNFDQRFADALTDCKWGDLVNADTAMAQVNKQNIAGFDFCIKVIALHDNVNSNDEGALKRYYYGSQMREIFSRLSFVTPNNYQTVDTCRLLVVPHLKDHHKNYAIEDAIEQMYLATPQTVIIHQGLMDCLAQMDVNWNAVFENKHPFKVEKQKDLFGAVAFFQRHPQIFEVYSLWAQEQKTKYEEFCAFCEKNIFKVSNNTPGDLFSILSSDFQKYAGDDLNRWNGYGEVTPNEVLSAFKNDSFSLHYAFKDEMRKFAQKENPQLNTEFCHIVASEVLFEQDPSFITSVLKGADGVAKIQQYALFPPHLKVVVKHLLNSNFAQQKKMLIELQSIADADGNTMSHLLASKLSTENLKDPDIQKLVLLCMKTNWSTKNAAGETPSTLFNPPNEEMGHIAQEIFNKHLDSTVTQHLKDKKVKPQKTTQRKI